MFFKRASVLCILGIITQILVIIIYLYYFIVFELFGGEIRYTSMHFIK